MSVPKINELYVLAQSGNRDDLNRLCEALSARFRMFMRHKVGNDEDVEDIVQDAIMTIINELHNVKIKTSFSAWAYKVLEYRFLTYLQKKGRRSAREDILSESAMDNIGDGKTFDPELRRKITGCMQKLVDTNLRGARIINLYHQGFTTDELVKENYDSAAIYFRKVYDISQTFPFAFMYAKASTLAGRNEDAIEEFEKWLNIYDVEWRLIIGNWSNEMHYYLGMAYENTGQYENAIRQYKTYADILKNADERLDSVEDAKQRLAKLTDRS